MSQALFVAVQELQKRVDAIESAKEEQKELIESLRKERREFRAEIKDMKEKLDRIVALESTIRKDAERILGRKRDPIDPNKAEMPNTLKELGFGQEKR